MDHKENYRSEFINRYGENWIFEYNYNTRKGVLRGSDVNWQPHPVVDGRVGNLLLNDEELLWLRQAWKEAVSH
jgi:hypothetical protein